MRQFILHFEQAKFSCYIEAITSYVLGGITGIKFAVNSKSETMLSPVLLIGCFCYVAFVTYIRLVFVSLDIFRS